MTTGRVVANAGTHRLLEALASGPKLISELKRVVGAVNGNNRFESEYMERMRSNGYACKKGYRWHITKAGMRMLERLGPTMLPKVSVAQPRTPLSFSGFTPIYDRPQPARAGSLDFKQLPSRVGNKLYYPDGRVVDLGE